MRNIDTLAVRMLQGTTERSGPAPRDATTERILAATLRQFEEFGIRRSTMEDVARRAGVSRVTIYRRFPGKDALVEAVLLHEDRRFFDELDAVVGRCESVDERLAEGFAFALRYLRRHALLNRLLRTEPESLLPHLTLRAGPVLGAVRGFIAERLGEEVRDGRLPSLDVEVAGEMLGRLVLSFLLTPETAIRLRTARDARAFARRYLVPALWAAAGEPVR